MEALVSVSGQVNPRLSPQPLVRPQFIVTGTEQALVRARAAMKSQNFAQATDRRYAGAERGTSVALTQSPATHEIFSSLLSRWLPGSIRACWAIPMWTPVNR
jgi:hypothetical protein